MSFLKRTTALIPFVGSAAKAQAPIEAFGPSSDSPIHQAFASLIAGLDRDEQVHLAVRVADNGVQLSAKRETMPTRGSAAQTPPPARLGDEYLPGMHTPGFEYGDQSVAGEFVTRAQIPNGVGGTQAAMVYRNPVDGRFYLYQMLQNPVRLELMNEVNGKPEWVAMFRHRPPLHSQAMG